MGLVLELELELELELVLAPVWARSQSLPARPPVPLGLLKLRLFSFSIFSSNKILGNHQ
jgi:hypothetical protein